MSKGNGVARYLGGRREPGIPLPEQIATWLEQQQAPIQPRSIQSRFGLSPRQLKYVRETLQAKERLQTDACGRWRVVTTSPPAPEAPAPAQPLPETLADRVLAYVTAHPGVSPAAICKALEMRSDTQVARACRLLRERGRVVATGERADRRYWLPGQAPAPTALSPRGAAPQAAQVGTQARDAFDLLIHDLLEKLGAPGFLEIADPLLRLTMRTSWALGRLSRGGQP